MKNRILSMICMFGLVVLSGCTAEKQLNTERIEGTPKKESTVRFQLDSKTAFFGTVQSKTRSGQVQLDSEKKITSLMAVVFRSQGGSSAAENNSDTFIKAIEISPAAQDGESLQFALASEGKLQICFVANADQNLANAIKGLASDKTVLDFKALEVTQAPDTQNELLMTSKFYAVEAVLGETATIESVEMTRAMARIDIENACDGITITEIVFHNRSVKSVLVNDNDLDLNTGFLESDAKRYSLNMVGNSQSPAKKEAAIYSYEQFAKVGADLNNERPYLEVHYGIEGESSAYIHNIYFEEESASGKKAIPLKRNTLYRVAVRNDNSKIKFNITVSDWNTGKVYCVTSDELVSGVLTRFLAVGDFMLEDGSIIKSDDAGFEAKKGKVVGVVAALYRNGVKAKSGVIRELKEHGVDTPHGLVLALSEASRLSKWGEDILCADVAYTTLVSNYKQGKDGCELTNYSIGNIEPNLYSVVKAYNAEVPTPSKTTTWYLPSIGEWMDILGQDGIGGIAEVQQAKDCPSQNIALEGCAGKALHNINKILVKLKDGGVNYLAFSMHDWYWSSSEFSKEAVYDVYFYQDAIGSKESLNFDRIPKNTGRGIVRCVLAF